MAKTYSVDLSDLEWKLLAWKHVSPGQHIDDVVTGRVKIAIKELAEQEIARRHADPNWTDPIPADYEAVLNTMIIKSAKDMIKEQEEFMKIMVANPDYATTNPSPQGFYPIPTGPKP